LNGVMNQNVDYDALGNITNKLDVGSYTYHSTKKHQVVSTGAPTNWSFTYDNNGNMTTGRGGVSIDWTSYNYPSCIRMGSTCSGSSTDYAQFSYTPDRQYWKQEAYYTGGSGGAATTIYVGGILEKVTTTAGTDYRHMIRAGNSTIIVSRQSGGTNSVYYMTQDHLGSSSAITNSTGGVLVNETFDAYGKRRGSNWSGAPTPGDWTAIATITRRGYTDHSMLDNLGLIHMNGRVQDPWLARFLSADPFIPEPLDTQSFNRYSYVQNRPLSYIDPSGFRETGILAWDFQWSFGHEFVGMGAFWQELRESYLEHPDPTDRVSPADPGAAPAPPPPGPSPPGPTGQSASLPGSIGQWSATSFDAVFADSQRDERGVPGYATEEDDENLLFWLWHMRFLHFERWVPRDFDAGANRIVGRSIDDNIHQQVTAESLSHTAEPTAYAISSVAEQYPSQVAEMAASEVLAQMAPAVRAGLAEARLARDSLSRSLASQPGRPPATVTAGYNTRTGQVAARACGDGKCAEDHVAAALGGNKREIKFTEAVRPRTGAEVPICERCEATYGRGAFPPGTQFYSGP